MAERPMRHCLFLLASLLLLTTVATSNATTVVKNLDLKRYMGRWYEIARFPTFFEKSNAVDTRARYTLNDNGTVHVLNEDFVDGKRSYVEGIAYKADPNSDEAKLKVKFYVPPSVPLFPVIGDYWVLYIDQDYQNAVVGGPTKIFLWILSRKSHIDDATYKELVEKAKNEGYDVSKLRKTPQSEKPPPAAEEGV
ncbi:temperature-induced lipocalin-1-like isoform X2 [Arachis hypogaea]|uniref:temperature-induced lipocalin-1-like isoform X2 n=1 Tax=Arachis hypogaea TaxID=3818 RepID=UPI000DECF1DB|nr:temperature-induced lipocalin-1-like [Arachis hypogaea]